MRYDEDTEHYLEQLEAQIYELQRENAELKEMLDYYKSMQLPILEIKDGR